MSINWEEVERIAPQVRLYRHALVDGMAKYNISDKRERAAMFLAHTHVESYAFSKVTEDLYYRPDRIRDLARQSPAGSRWRALGPRADELARNPSALAEAAYGGRMGNGPEGTGDGYKFRGRGLKQLTGKVNYRAFSLWWRGDESLLLRPDDVAGADGAVASALWFWVKHVPIDRADAGDVEAVTRAINGGKMGLADRQAMYDRYLRAWRAE